MYILFHLYPNTPFISKNSLVRKDSSNLVKLFPKVIFEPTGCPPEGFFPYFEQNSPKFMGKTHFFPSFLSFPYFFSLRDKASSFHGNLCHSFWFVFNNQTT